MSKCPATYRGWSCSLHPGHPGLHESKNKLTGIRTWSEGLKDPEGAQSLEFGYERGTVGYMKAKECGAEILPGNFSCTLDRGHLGLHLNKERGVGGAKWPTEQSTAEEAVNHPAHYTMGSIESIEFIEDQGHGKSFCYGNAMKYINRAPHKGKEREDLRKAIWYINRRIKQIDEG